MTVSNSANLVKKYIGVDIGGMTIKGIIIRGDGEVLCQDTIETESEQGGDKICFNIVKLINRMIHNIGGFKDDIKGVGIGCPGLIDSKRGMVVFAGNLNLHYYPLARVVADSVGLPVKITNDANAAALGEAKFGGSLQSIFIKDQGHIVCVFLFFKQGLFGSATCLDFIQQFLIRFDFFQIKISLILIYAEL